MLHSFGDETEIYAGFSSSDAKELTLTRIRGHKTWCTTKFYDAIKDTLPLCLIPRRKHDKTGIEVKQDTPNPVCADFEEFDFQVD